MEDMDSVISEIRCVCEKLEKMVSEMDERASDAQIRAEQALQRDPQEYKRHNAKVFETNQNLKTISMQNKKMIGEAKHIASSLQSNFVKAKQLIEDLTMLG